jgi:hypothetical protein
MVTTTVGNLVGTTLTGPAATLALVAQAPVTMTVPKGGVVPPGASDLVRGILGGVGSLAKQVSIKGRDGTLDVAIQLIKTDTGEWVQVEGTPAIGDKVKTPSGQTATVTQIFGFHAHVGLF